MNINNGMSRKDMYLNVYFIHHLCAIYLFMYLLIYLFIYLCMCDLKNILKLQLSYPYLKVRRAGSEAFSLLVGVLIVHYGRNSKFPKTGEDSIFDLW